MKKEAAARVGTCNFGPSRTAFDGSAHYKICLESIPAGYRETSGGQCCEQIVVVLRGKMSCQVGGQDFCMSAGKLEQGELPFLTIPPDTEYSCQSCDNEPGCQIRICFPKAEDR